MSRTRKYLDEVFPRVVAKQDEAYRPIRQLNEAVNRSHERVKSRATTPRQKLVVSQKQENYNVAQRRQRQVTTKGYEPTKKEQQQYKREDIKRAKRHRVEKALSSDKPIIVQTQQAQLWDKDKADLAKTQQAFYRDAAANVGVDWGNRLDPYTQGDLINGAFKSFGTTNLVPYTLPATALLGGANLPASTFMATTVGGEVGGLVGSQVLPAVWDNPYAGIIGGIGGGILGSGTGYILQQAPYIRLANAFNNNIKNAKLNLSVVRPDFNKVISSTKNNVVKSDRDIALDNIRALDNARAKGTMSWLAAGDKAQHYVDKINNGDIIPIDTKLNWNSKDWFSSRPKGQEPTVEEIAEFEANIPEYLQIQQNAGDNWLIVPGGIWKGDPREWVMMQSKAYKDYMKHSKVKTPFTHIMENFSGNTIQDKGIIGGGRLFGNGFYGYVNPEGKLQAGYSTKDFSLQAAKPHGTFVANVKNPINLTNADITPLMFDIGKRHSADRVGSFHNPKFEGAGPYSLNDMGFMTRKRTEMGIFGYPNDEGYAYPQIKFVTGNTGAFKRTTNNIFRSLIPIALSGTLLDRDALYKLSKNKNNKTN